MSSLSSEFKQHIVNLVRDTMEYREKHNLSRKDFIQLLMELRKTGRVRGDDASADSEKNEQSEENQKEFMTIEQCSAQVALFYLAGFDTTASAIAYCLFELSRNPDLMKRLHDEIDEVMAQHNNVLSYETINKMTFLDYCLLGIVIYGHLFELYMPYVGVIHSRNTQKISNIAVPKSTVHKRLSNTKYWLSHQGRNTDYYITSWSYA